MTLPSFAELGVSEPIRAALTAQGYSASTPIQARAIPILLAGKDLEAGHGNLPEKAGLPRRPQISIWVPNSTTRLRGSCRYSMALVALRDIQKNSGRRQNDKVVVRLATRVSRLMK